MTKPVCVILGVGPGNSAAFARLFSKKGYSLALLARSTELTTTLANELGDSRAYQCDVTDVDLVKTVFKKIKNELGDIDTLIYNAGSGASGTIEEITPEDFELNWRVNNLGLFVATQVVIPSMKARNHGNIIVIGATASLRARAQTTAFAAAKTAQRSLTQSIAKYLWPFKIHVALVIIDGVVDLPRTRAQMPEKQDDFFVKPEAVAETVFWLTQQPQSAWSFEVEARPFKENW